jgi:FkbH-like protein
MKYSEILKKNSELDASIDSNVKPYKIAILSNIMVHQSKEICEYSLRRKGVSVEVRLGDYDNILQESFNVKGLNAVIVFWELSNLIDGLQFKIDNLSSDEFDGVVEKIKREINLTLSNLKNVPIVLINKFSTLVFDQFNVFSTRYRVLSNTLNDFLENNLTENIVLVELDAIISKISIGAAIDMRYYYSSKTLYSIKFYKEYFESIMPVFLSLNGKTKKAIIFDCDNTLWKGVLGEDGVDAIKIYEEVQSLALALSNKGVILALCSKNNPSDVDDVLKNHSGMVLKDEHILIKKVNWQDKVTNIKKIAEELNLGLDSFVFIDDSEFEVGFVKEKLPMVEVFQVPRKEYEYSMMFRELSKLFYNPITTKEDHTKLELYKTQIQRKKLEDQTDSLEEYLESLGLCIKVYIDDVEEISRIAQLTQKTNQFNLTTRRYANLDIENFIKDSNKIVITIRVLDKFGDNGIVGLAIIDYNKRIANIDSLLMSCRVIGRNLEYKFMDAIVEILNKKKIKKIQSSYIKTLKNTQVSSLYENFGFEVDFKNDEKHLYQIELNKYNSKNINYIEVEHEK